MGKRNLLRFYRSFRSQIQQNHAAFSVFNGTNAGISRHGVQFYLEHVGGRVKTPSWVPNAYFALQREDFVPSEWAVRVFVKWSYLLWQARPTSSSPLRTSAHHLLRVLRPLVEQYDQILARDIELFEARWYLQRDKAEGNPLFFGQSTAEDEERFERHLRALLSNSDFRRRLMKTMQDTMHPLTDVTRQRRLALCPEGNHGFEKSCDRCEGFSWARWTSSLLDPSAFESDAVIQRVLTPKLSLPAYYRPTDNELLRLYAWILSAQPEDGVVECQGGLLVDFARLASLLRTQEVCTKLLHAAAQRDRDAWLQGSFLQQRVAAQDPELLAPPRYSPRDAAEKQGWESRDSLETPYLILRPAAIRTRLGLATRKARSMGPGFRRQRRRAPAVRRTAILSYLGQEITVVLRRLRGRYEPPQAFYSLPYLLNQEDERATKGGVNSTRIGSTLYWSTAGVHAHAKILSGGEYPVYPEAGAFLQWLLAEDATMDEARFNSLRYQNTLGDRLAELHRGERKQLGPYTKVEDQAIEEMVSARVNKGGLTLLEWDLLLERLLGRSKDSVAGRIRHLGKKFALQHGWVEYVNSYWCFKNSAEVRERWRKEGVPP